jgi:hypothetical protein
MANMIKSSDFFRESSLESQLDEGYKLMIGDRRFTLFAPGAEDWQKTPLSVKLLACILYNEISRKRFMEMLDQIKPADASIPTVSNTD